MSIYSYAAMRILKGVAMLYIKESDIDKYGVFTDKKLSAGDKIPAITKKFARLNPNFGGYNHSCKANIKLGRGTNFEIVLRDIEIGEELLVEYSWLKGRDDCNCDICKK